MHPCTLPMQSPSRFTSASFGIRLLFTPYAYPSLPLPALFRPSARSKGNFDFCLCEQQQFILTKYKTRRGELENYHVTLQLGPFFGKNSIKFLLSTSGWECSFWFFCCVYWDFLSSFSVTATGVSEVGLTPRAARRSTRLGCDLFQAE